MPILNPSVITKKLEKVEELRSRILVIVGECMMEHKEEIVALLEYQQYSEGVDSANNPLRQYSPGYEFMKTKAGLYTGKTDLHYSGEFQAGINLAVDGEAYTFDSPATTLNGILKSTWLNEWNKKTGGSDIMELTPENKKIVWTIIAPTFRYKSANELVSN